MSSQSSLVPPQLLSLSLCSDSERIKFSPLQQWCGRAPLSASKSRDSLTDKGGTDSLATQEGVEEFHASQGMNEI